MGLRTDIAGSNRSGAHRSPEMLEAMIAATAEFPPSARGDARGIAEARAERARRAEPFATMPPPTSVGQLAKNTLRVVSGQRPFVLLDRLGERLAFERNGTRLYEGLLSKHDADRTFRGGPTREDLKHIRDEEHEHAKMIEEAILALGGDPTVVTPCANLQATASMGLCAVVADPRTDLQQCLEAMLVAELVDNDCWPALIELAETAGEDALVKKLAKALENEREHLERVRTWVAAASSRSVERALAAGAEVERPSPFKANGSSSLRATASARPRSVKGDGRGSGAKKSRSAKKTSTASRRTSRAGKSAARKKR